MSIPKNHYFNPVPEVASKRHTVRLHTGELDLELQADRGVFGARRVDLGTLTLLKEAPAPPAAGDILDLGAGYGPIAIALARASPDARIWAVDVNQPPLTKCLRASASRPSTRTRPSASVRRPSTRSWNGGWTALRPAGPPTWSCSATWARTHWPPGWRPQAALWTG